MATSDGKIATLLLHALEEAGIRYAVLHRETDVSDGMIDSDVDLIIDRSPYAVALELAKCVSSSVLRLAMVWPYDTASLTTFWVTPDCADGLQLDLLYDPAGRGKYGLRTNIGLLETVRGKRWIRLTPEAELAYLLSKRSYKNQLSEVQHLLDHPEFPGLDEVVRSGLLSRSAAIRVLRLKHAPHRHGSAISRLSNKRVSPSRVLMRLRVPIGARLRILSSDDSTAKSAAAELKSRLSRTLVRVMIVDKVATFDRLRDFALMRRPSVVLVVGDGFLGIEKSIEVLQQETHDDVGTAVSAHLHDASVRILEKLVLLDESPMRRWLGV